MLATVALLAGLLVAATAGAATTTVPERISGADRYETAAAVSASRFDPGVPVAHVVTGEGYPDALVAGVAAGLGEGPVLLVTHRTIPAATEAELARLDPAELVVVGGTASVSEEVVEALGDFTDGAVVRRDGPDRYATAAAVARATFPDPGAVGDVYVASGEGFADALAAVSVAVRARAPLLLTTRSSLPAATADVVRDLDASRAVLLGGTATISDGVEAELRDLTGEVFRVGGADRFATSAELSSAAFPDPDTVSDVYLATGHGFTDALAAGPVAGLAGAPVLLVRTNCVPGRVLQELDRLGAQRLVLLGGDRAVGRHVEDRIRCPHAGAAAGEPAVDPAPAPAWDDDGPDPHVIRFGDTWYAYTTGTTWGNNLGVLVSDRPDGGWRTASGEEHGSTALADVPDWQEPDTQWAPAVYRFAGRYVLFYAAKSAARGEWCLSVATSQTPAGPFHDGSTGPLVCQDHLGGAIDPHPFVDVHGDPWLHFKTNDGFDSDAVSRVLVTRLADDGTTPVGSYHEVLRKDTSRYSWQTTVDNPQMVLRDGVHYLFHTGGNYVGDDTYAVGYAVCDGPLGPCETAPEPILSSDEDGDVAGPGGGTVAVDTAGNWWLSYHAWPSDCFDYSCGVRRLYVAPLAF